MFGQSKPVVIDRYGRRGSRWSPPRWLVLLVLGMAVGAGGVLFVQQRYLPPRLSAAESTTLRAAYATADGDRQRLKLELDATAAQRDAALADAKRLGADLAASRDEARRGHELAASLVASLPPDPRGGAVEVRAARFAVEGGSLAYDLVLTRPRAGTKPVAATLQLAVTGAGGRDAESTVALKPVVISIGAYESLRGALPMPPGFKPREVTISVVGGAGGKPLGWRVMAMK